MQSYQKNLVVSIIFLTFVACKPKHLHLLQREGHTTLMYIQKTNRIPTFFLKKDIKKTAHLGGFFIDCQCFFCAVFFTNQIAKSSVHQAFAEHREQRLECQTLRQYFLHQSNNLRWSSCCQTSTTSSVVA